MHFFRSIKNWKQGDHWQKCTLVGIYAMLKNALLIFATGLVFLQHSLPSFYLQRPQIKWLLRLINWSGDCRTLADSPWPSSHLPSFNSLEYFLDCSKAKCLGSGAFDSWNNNKRCLFFKGLSHQVLFTQWENFTEIRSLNHLMFFFPYSNFMKKLTKANCSSRQPFAMSLRALVSLPG